MTPASTNPVFSIIMPSYNVEGLISFSIESVLSQDLTDFELIIVDDGSTDGTWERISQFADRDKRVLLCRNEGSRGPAAARNFGVSKARGEWVCFLDSDDVFLPGVLSARKSAIDRYPDCRFFSSDFIFWYPDNKTKDVKKTDENPVWKRYFNTGEAEDNCLLVQTPISAFLETVIAWTGGVVVKKSLFEQLGGFSEDLLRGEDDHLWLRCAAASDSMVFMLSANVLYRQRSDGITGGTSSVSRYAPLVFKKLMSDPLFSGKRQALNKLYLHHIYINSLFCREWGQKWQALIWSFKYFIHKPLDRVAVRNLLACLVGRA